jgi:hypothetical protein
MKRYTKEQWQTYQRDVLAFLRNECRALVGDRYVEPGLFPEQERVVTALANGKVRTAYLSWPRKIGKTWSAAHYCLWLACTRHNQLVLLVSPAKVQSKDLAFAMLIATLENNPTLVANLNITWTRDAIYIGLTGSEIKMIGRGLSVAAGRNPSVVLVDELASFVAQPDVDFLQEVTLPSTTRGTQVIYCSYRGWRGRSVELERIEILAAR